MSNMISKLKILIGATKASLVQPFTEMEKAFIRFVSAKISLGEKIINRKSLENKAYKEFGIHLPKTVKECIETGTLMEFKASVENAKKLYAEDPSLKYMEKKTYFLTAMEVYGLQANLSARFSETIQLQQYSTPVPIATLLQMYVSNMDFSKTAFEPTAGNGMMLTLFDPKKCFVNELDFYRIKSLQYQGFKTITQIDATNEYLYEGLDKKFDCIIANPPFGTMDKARKPYGFVAEIKNLERFIIMSALRTMKDDGRAAFIVGKHFIKMEGKGEMKRDIDHVFFTNIKKFYDLVDVINVNGELYSKMGTKFDVSIILIGPRKKDTSKTETPEFTEDSPLKVMDTTVVKTYSELFDRFSNHF